MPSLPTVQITVWLLVILGSLSGCASTATPANKTVYDLGAVAAPVPAGGVHPLASALAITDIQSNLGQSSTAMQYRLTYANAQVLQPYALASWSVPPAQLLSQRLRAVLSQRRPVVAWGEGQTTHVLQISLEEFGQTFSAPDTSVGTVHVRATLLKGDQPLAQRDFSASVPAPTPDATGGVRALAMATQTVAQALSDWVAQTAP